MWHCATLVRVVEGGRLLVRVVEGGRLLVRVVEGGRLLVLVVEGGRSLVRVVEGGGLLLRVVAYWYGSGMGGRGERGNGRFLLQVVGGGRLLVRVVGVIFCPLSVLSIGFIKTQICPRFFLLDLFTCSGFEAVKSAPWPSQGLTPLVNSLTPTIR